MNAIRHNIIAEEDKDLESSTAPERYMVVRGSMKSKLPPALVIKSCNLRVLDPIGQGIIIMTFLDYSGIILHADINVANSVHLRIDCLELKKSKFSVTFKGFFNHLAKAQEADQGAI
jgi:hypothetical protein